MKHAVVLRTPSVRYGQLATEFGRLGTDWETVKHLAATSSLASAIRQSGHPAAHAAAVLDLCWSGDARRAELMKNWPDVEVLTRNRKEYEGALTEVASLVRGLRMQEGLLFDDRLRLWADGLVDQAERRQARVLVHARQELARTISTLVQAGVAPQGGHLEPATDLGRLAVEAWIGLENALPEIARPREVLWPLGRDVSLRDGLIGDALSKTTGFVVGDVVAHHGFYFYTPPQWQLFNSLDEMGIRQIFVVHDDGRSRAFETWRRYFSAEWGFDDRRGSPGPSPSMGLLDMALTGLRVESPSTGRRVRIARYRSPADMAMSVSRSSSELDVIGYAADRTTVKRWLQRLHGQAATGRVDFGSLPIGAFLRGIYGSIAESPDGEVRIELNAARLVDVLAADVIEGAGRDEAALLRQAAQFFGGARSAEDWVHRAASLYELVGSTPESLAKMDGETDRARIQRAVRNPLRTVPWLDLSEAQAKSLLEAIQTVVAVIDSIVDGGRLPLKDHWKRLDAQLTTRLQDIDEATADEVVTRMYGFQIGSKDTEVGVQSVADVVSIILAGPADPGDDDGDEAANGPIRDLRALDALGLAPVKADLRVLNLADGSFPRPGTGLGWPFQLEELVPSDATRARVRQLVTTRRDTAALSDLYLLVLALGGAADSHEVELSWVERVRGEDLSMSPFLALVAELDPRLDESMRERVGGLAVERVSIETGLDGHSLDVLPEPVSSGLPVQLDGLDRTAAASGEVCARRFALQWVLSRSHAWQARHHQAMEHGNAPAALAQAQAAIVSPEFAARLANGGWVWLSDAERVSSRAKAVVQMPPKGGGPKPVWVQFLQGGKKVYSNKDVPYSNAVNAVPPSAPRLFGQHEAWLPPGVGSDDARQCAFCPVRDVCSVAQRE